MTDGDASPRRPQSALKLEWLGDLLGEPEEEVRWLVDQRLVVGGFSLISGKPKAGKSTLARCLALAVARGTPWLGWATQQGTVIYLALEEKRDEVRRHFQTMGAVADEPILVWIAPSPSNGLAQLQQATKEYQPALIIVDPLFRFIHAKDTNDYPEMTRVLDPLLRLGRDTGAHVVGVHHLRKGRGSGADDSLGSTSIGGIVDTTFLLWRAEGGRTLRTVQRYGPELEPTIITLDPANGVVSAGPLQRDATEAVITDAIMGFLRNQTAAVEEAAIVDGVRGDTATKERVLRKLVERHVVNRIGRGVKRDPYRYMAVNTAGEKGGREGSTDRDAREGSGQSYETEAGERLILPCSPAPSSDLRGRISPTEEDDDKKVFAGWAHTRARKLQSRSAAQPIDPPAAERPCALCDQLVPKADLRAHVQAHAAAEGFSL